MDGQRYNLSLTNPEKNVGPSETYPRQVSLVNFLSICIQYELSYKQCKLYLPTSVGMYSTWYTPELLLLTTLFTRLPDGPLGDKKNLIKRSVEDIFFYFYKNHNIYRILQKTEKWEEKKTNKCITVT